MASQPSEYEKKLIEMQYQMKINNEYMKDTFLDLENWSKEMKAKESDIKNLVKQENKGLPPIRNLAEKKKKKKKVVNSSKEPKPKTKIKAYDYKQWDKLDVDKLCEEVDNTKTSSSEYTTDEEWEEEQKKVKANWEKERGNHFFKDNLFIEAIECYTKAIEYDPLNPIYLANRAACLIKQEKYAAAEKDCTQSIALDSTYTKAYHRRATARVHLNKLQEAKSDYEFLLTKEPNSKLFQTEYNKLQSQIDNIQLVFPIVKTEAERSQKPLIRIQIEEINDETEESIQASKTLEEINQKIKLTTKDEELFNVNKKTHKTKKFEEVDDRLTSNTNRQVTNSKEQIKEILKVEDLRINEKIKVKNLVPIKPLNAYQFKKDYQSISKNLDDLASYFKHIVPEDYSKIFLNGLESEVLSKVLVVFKMLFINDQKNDLLGHMKSLAQVKRFKTQLMFLTKEDKQNINELLDHLKTKIENNELESLKKMFEF